jgi:hypothetical protein
MTMQDQLLPSDKQKGDAFSLLVKYVQDPAAIELTSDAEKLLKRLMFADAKMKTRKFTEEEVINELMATFTISEFTALRDIKQAQKLFVAARGINKQYFSHLHLERINKDIEDTRDRLFWEENDEMPGVKFPRVPDAKELAALARLHQAYSFTLNTAPEEKGQDVLPPPVFNFSQVVINTGMSVEQAMKEADSLLNGAPTPSELKDYYQDAEDADWEESDPEE